MLPLEQMYYDLKGPSKGSLLKTKDPKDRQRPQGMDGQPFAKYNPGVLLHGNQK